MAWALVESQISGGGAPFGSEGPKEASPGNYAAKPRKPNANKRVGIADTGEIQRPPQAEFLNKISTPSGQTDRLMDRTRRR
jgi:hypothetical protein